MKYPDDFVDKIITGDCLEVMKDIPDNCVDLTITDPPYNAKNIGPNKKEYKNQIMQLEPCEYKRFCRDWFREVKRISKRILFTPGIAQTHNYPTPKWQICWHKPAAVSFNRFYGFNAWEPIFIYGDGKGVKLGQDYILHNTLNFNKGPEKEHPCPKPLNLWKKLIIIFSKENDIIMDPFLGSGTTAVACKELDRHYIGIEKEPEYVEIALKRLRALDANPRML